MTPSATGTYVAAADYDKLSETLNQVLATAAEYFRQVENRETIAADAETALRVLARLIS